MYAVPVCHVLCICVGNLTTTPLQQNQMASERQSMPDLRDIPPDRPSQRDERLSRSVPDLHVTKEEKEDGIVENSDDAFNTRVKPKTKKKMRSWKSKSKISDTESPGVEGKKEKVPLKTRFKRLFTQKRVMNSYKLTTPQVGGALKANTSQILVKGQNEDIKKHETIIVKPVGEGTDLACDHICECDRVKELERELSQLESEKLAMEKDMLNTIEKQSNAISEMTSTLTTFIQNTRYVKLSGCQNIQIGDSGCDPKELLEPVRDILDGLCKNNEEVKRMAKNILQTVEEMQTSSTKDRSQQTSDMMHLQEVVERMLSHMVDDVYDNPLDDVSQQEYSTPEDTSNRHRIASDSSDGSCVVWGRSDVISDVSSRQHDILKTLINVKGLLQRLEINSEILPALDEIGRKLNLLLFEKGKSG